MRRGIDGPRSRFAGSHPSHKNKNVARVGHPGRVGVGGFPGLRIETWGTHHEGTNRRSFDSVAEATSLRMTLRVGHQGRVGVGGFPGLSAAAEETWGTRPFQSTLICIFVLTALLALAGCHGTHRDHGTVVFLIESSPANLDPRIGADAQSQRIDALLFDGLVARNASFQFTPALAERWEQPNPLTLIFHLRGGVRFHDGRALTARDVAWTIESMIDPMRSGAVISPKAAAYTAVDTVEAPDDRTVVLHLKHADNFLLTNLSTGAIGIVPEGSGRDFWQHPVGTGPFRFVSQQIDQDVVVERNPQSWAAAAKIERVRFAVVPDAITRSLELEKGSGDVAVNSLPMDSLAVLATRPKLQVEDSPGTQIQYLSFNLRDPLLQDARVRQAIACAIDRKLIIDTLMGGHARTAESLLPESHWAYSGEVARYDYDPAHAARLLDEAGAAKGADGVRFHLTMKTSTDE